MYQGARWICVLCKEEKSIEGLSMDEAIEIAKNHAKDKHPNLYRSIT